MEKWVDQNRAEVRAYLISQGIQAPEIGEWPAFECAPYFAIWAIESKITPGAIGWWAFSGDCPTDYISQTGDCNPRAALGKLLQNWSEYIPQLKAGRNPPKICFGSEAELPMLAEFLEERVSVLRGWYLDDDLWESA